MTTSPAKPASFETRMQRWVMTQNREPIRAARLRETLSDLKVEALLDAGIPADEAEGWLKVAQSLPEGYSGTDNDRNLRKVIAARKSGLTATDCLSWAIAGEHWTKIVPELLPDEEPNRLHHAGWDGYAFAVLFERERANVEDAEGSEMAVYRIHHWTGTGIPPVVVLFYLLADITASEAEQEWEPLRVTDPDLWEGSLRTLYGLRTHTPWHTLP